MDPLPFPWGCAHQRATQLRVVLDRRRPTSGSANARHLPGPGRRVRAMRQQHQAISRSMSAGSCPKRMRKPGPRGSRQERGQVIGVEVVRREDRSCETDRASRPRATRAHRLGSVQRCRAGSRAAVVTPSAGPDHAGADRPPAGGELGPVGHRPQLGILSDIGVRVQRRLHVRVPESTTHHMLPGPPTAAALWREYAGTSAESSHPGPARRADCGADAPGHTRCRGATTRIAARAPD